MAGPPATFARVPDAHIAEHEPDRKGLQQGYIRATDYAHPYRSVYSRVHPDEFAKLLRCLNCSYLSTPGTPPTLVALKQHAQALCNLILLLTPTMNGTGVIDVANVDLAQDGPSYHPTLPRYDQNEAFDFLTDLSKPYTNDDPHHHLPLTSLLNEVEGRSDVFGTAYHCPLKHDEDAKTPVHRAKGQAISPYQNQHMLVMHANECLERLDHEYSTDGGLLAILPGDEAHEHADKKMARNTLLGQWLGFTQQLVRRQHELEISYGNALDVLAGDAVVPYATMGSMQPDGRDLGRQICFPQDRWVLANAGEDIWGYLHKALDNQELVAQVKEKEWKAKGVSGEKMWFEKKGGKETARGIVHVTIPTRFYRLAGTGHGTMFVVPGHDHHPGVAHTGMLEKYPKIIGTPMPTYPERVTALDKAMKEARDEMEKTVNDLHGAAQRARHEARGKETYKNELERVSAERDALRQAVGGEIDLVQELAATKAMFVEEKEKRGREAEKMLEEIHHLQSRNAELIARWVSPDDYVIDADEDEQGDFAMSGAL